MIGSLKRTDQNIIKKKEITSALFLLYDVSNGFFWYAYIFFSHF